MHTPPDVTPSIRRSLVTWWAYLVLATTLLALVIAQRYFIVAELDESPAIWAFRILMLIAHFAALSSLLLFPVLIVAWLWPKPRAVVPLGITVSAVILIALLVDTQVYQLYRFHINAGVMNLSTRIGVFSFFYSIPGTYWHSLLVDKKGPVFVDELLKRDYDVNVFRSAPLHSPEFHRTVFAQLNEPRMRSDGADPAEWDRDLTDDFLSFLNSRDSKKPFFSFLFYDAPHNFILAKDHPVVFEPIAEEVNYFALNNDTDKTPLLNRYWNSLNYVDSLIGEVLSSLEDRALLDDTVVIITGDHGQEFNDNGRNYWGHSSNFSRYQTGVPFVFYAPRVQPAVVSHRTTHFDVVPTLLHDYFGCAETPSNYSVGRSLFEPGGREALVLSEYADFAIAENDRIAVVRKHGMTVHGPGYAELPGHLDASTIRSALEQKTRFYRGAPRISRAK